MTTPIALHTMLNAAMITILIFGAYLMSLQLPKSKIKAIFITLSIFWCIPCLMDSVDQITRANYGDDIASPLNYYAILTGVISQPFLLFLFYNLLFSLKSSIKFVTAQMAFILALFIAIWICDYIDPTASRFDTYNSVEEGFAAIGTPLMTLKLAVVVTQLLLAIIIYFVTRGLLPIYQSYIEKNESNHTYNVLWIKEISTISLIITTVYTLDILFITYATAYIYYGVVCISFMRMIGLLLHYRQIDDFGGLYHTLGVKWNFSRMWYIDQQGTIDSQVNLDILKKVDSWITRYKPYTNPNFSFKDVNRRFPEINYNDFDIALKNSGGTTFQAYIRERRINDALKLMNRSDATIKEVAFKVGFENNSSFARAFKAVKNIPASEWRNAE